MDILNCSINKSGYIKLMVILSRSLNIEIRSKKGVRTDSVRGVSSNRNQSLPYVEAIFVLLPIRSKI